jgi:hypothetical protein
MRWWTVALAFGCGGSEVVDSAAPPVSATDTTFEPVIVETDTVADSADTETEPPDTDTDTDTAADTETGTAPTGWRSALYPEDWAPGFALGDAALHDFSYAGYHNGEDPLPSTASWPRFDAQSHGADPTGKADSTAAIQAALDAASAAGGGVAWLEPGLYRVDGSLSVRTSGVVLGGGGSATTQVAFTRAEGTDGQAHLSFAGAREVVSTHPLVADGERFSHVVLVEDATEIAAGDDVSVGFTITEEFVADHGMTGVWQVALGQYRDMFRRTVVGVDLTVSPHAVTLDVPLRYPSLVRDGAALVVERGLISECGVEGLSVSTAVEWVDAWAHDRSHAIAIDQATDCFVRDLGSFESPYPADGRGLHLASNGVLVERSKRVTIADSELGYAQNRGEGGNGYLYEVMQSSDVLIRDCVGRFGRHNFVQNWDFGTSGVVFLRTLSEDGEALLDRSLPIGTIGYSEYHHSLAMANLVDSSQTADGWKAANRGDYSSGAGHAATESVFWNVSGDGWLKSYQYGLGYVIGTGPELNVDTTVWGFLDSEGTEPEDWVEGLGEAGELVPSSLYEDQLARRLGG